MEHIFLLEDDSTLRHGIALALETAQRVITQAETLAQATKILAAETFSLLILDINLPDGS